MTRDYQCKNFCFTENRIPFLSEILKVLWIKVCNYSEETVLGSKPSRLPYSNREMNCTLTQEIHFKSWKGKVARSST